MKKVYLLILSTVLIFVSFINIQAQTSGIDWGKNYGGSSVEYFNSMIKTNDGGYVAAGITMSDDIVGIGSEFKGITDAVIVKYKSDGSFMWQARYGGSLGDEFNSVCELKGGGYVAVGSISSTDSGLTLNGATDALIVRYSSAGLLLQAINVGGIGENRWTSVSATNDGGFIALGYYFGNPAINSSIRINKYDKNGALVWSKEYGGSLNEYTTSAKAIELTNGNLIITGMTYSTDFPGVNDIADGNIFFMELDLLGDIVWSKNFGGEMVYSIDDLIPTSDNFYVGVGRTIKDYNENNELEHNENAIILKFDNNFNIVWQKTFGGNDLDAFTSVCENEKKEYLVTGHYYSDDILGMPLIGGDTEGFVLKYSSNGELLMSVIHGGDNNDSLCGVVAIEEGYVFAGSLGSSTEYFGNNGLLDCVIGKCTYRYSVFYNVGDGVNKPDNGLGPKGTFRLTTNQPTHNQVNERDVFFLGWSLTDPETRIYENKAEAPALITSLNLTKDINVYAIYSYSRGSSEPNTGDSNNHLSIIMFMGISAIFIIGQSRKRSKV